MKKVHTISLLFLFVILGVGVLVSVPAFASPYGVGKYGADVPYGKDTSITISASNVVVSAAPGASGQLSTATAPVTVYSTDVTGYKLYVNALSSTDLTSTGGTIPASGNVSAAPLVVNTWGYNTDATTNFLGMTTSMALIKNLVGPSRLGDTTTVTYGIYVDNNTQAGSYTTTVLYTAVPQTT